MQNTKDRAAPAIVLPYAGSLSEQPLHEKPGQLVSLTGATADGAKSVQWAPMDKRAHEVELRARIMDVRVSQGEGGPAAPIIRWHVKVAHGSANYTLPRDNPRALTTAKTLGYSLPARGLVLRLPNRELDFVVGIDGCVDLESVCEQASVNVSFMPVLSSQCPLLPRQYLASPDALPINEFPMDANEWLITTENGQPVPAAAVSVTPFTLAGNALPAIDANALAAFHPIPHDACSFAVNGRCYISYR